MLGTAKWRSAEFAVLGNSLQFQQQLGLPKAAAARRRRSRGFPRPQDAAQAHAPAPRVGVGSTTTATTAAARTAPLVFRAQGSRELLRGARERRPPGHRGGLERLPKPLKTETDFGPPRARSPSTGSAEFSATCACAGALEGPSAPRLAGILSGRVDARGDPPTHLARRVPLRRLVPQHQRSRPRPNGGEERGLRAARLPETC